MALHAYGKILDVDLSTGKIARREIDPQFAREFVGGLGFSSKILYDEVGPSVDPFSPDNIVVFANGPLTGTQAPCSGRTEITTRSPLTGIIGTGNTGGLWGSALKRAGFDLVIVRKQAQKPVCLWINDDVIEIRDASNLWGKDTQVTSDILKQQLGSSSENQVSVLTIGPAGEHLVRYACTINDHHHAAARSGAGAIMGSKRLKAIAVHGSGSVNVARREEFQEAAREARERVLTADRAHASDGISGATSSLPRQSGWTDSTVRWSALGCLPARNYQTGFVQQYVETMGMDVRRRYVTKREGTCHGCPVGCFNLAEVNEGKYAGTRANRATHGGVIHEWGAKCGIDNVPAAWKCKELCQRYGMDYASASGSISFAMELFQRGMITAENTGGLELSWGNEDAIIEMLNRIAVREGFGDVLAEGSLRAAKAIGKGAEQYVMAMKGMELMVTDPRSGPRGFVFGAMTNPRGGDNTKNTRGAADHFNPSWWTDKFDMFEDVKSRIYSVPPQETEFRWEGKPMYCKWFEDLHCALDSLGICFIEAGVVSALGPTYLSRLVSACTGWDMTPHDLMGSGERILNVLKAYNVRLGLARSDDDWPDRFYREPLPEGPAKGAVLSRDLIAGLLDEYYELRGWDKRTGLPSGKKLVQLGLHGIADELAQLGKIRAAN